MPRFDGTGPCGTGSMTGRGFGNCRVAPAQTEVAPSAVRTPESVVRMGEYGPQSNLQAPIYGAGRGGMPRGCGNGRRSCGNQFGRRG